MCFGRRRTHVPWTSCYLGDARRRRHKGVDVQKKRSVRSLALPCLHPLRACCGARANLKTPGGVGKRGNETGRNELPRNNIAGCVGQRNERKEEEKEANSRGVGNGGHTASKPQSSLALPLRKEEVLDVPHGLFGWVPQPRRCGKWGLRGREPALCCRAGGDSVDFRILKKKRKTGPHGYPAARAQR